jgi:hypothetical protein
MDKNSTTDLDALHRAPDPRPVRLGEELPVFCERCGYSLHGLPQSRCDDCGLLQFICPECGHHQPINTLRPAAHKILGRIRAAWLVAVVMLKLNFFGWVLFGWFVAGHEVAYTYRMTGTPTVYSPGLTSPTYTMAPLSLDSSDLLGFGLFAVLFGLVARILLLRWRNGALVGAIVGSLVVAAIALGMYFRWQVWTSGTSRPNPYTISAALLMAATWAAVVAASTASWTLWRGAVRLLLPTRTASALLEWQCSFSSDVGALSRS